MSSKKEKVSEAVAADADAIIGDDTPTVDEAPAEATAETASADAPAEESKPVPKDLLEQLAAVEDMYSNVMKQIEDFKSGQAYLPGDIPVTLRGLGGPGFEIGQRKLNFIDERHLDSRFEFRWCNKNQTIVGHHMGNGRWPESWDEFDKMVLPRGGPAAVKQYRFRFQKSPENYVTFGDLVLMRTYKEQGQALRDANEKRKKNQEGVAKGPLMKACNDLGTEPIEGDRGPKIERLLQMLEKELGPQARRVFLGS